MTTILPRPPGSRRLATLALLAWACGAVGCGSADDRPRATPRPIAAFEPAATTEPSTDSYRIVVLGDSLSAGYGLAEADAFPALVEEGLNEAGHEVAIVNAGVSGDTTAGGLSRLAWVLRSEPDLLVVELGANDALRGQPLDNTERNLREIIRRGREAGARILLLGMDVPTSYGPDYTGAFTELYARIARDEGVAFVPGFIRSVGTDPALMQPDGLHPTAEGHRRLAAMLTPKLVEIIERGS